LITFKDFRQKILGTTDPKTAVEGSMRNYIYKNWQELGLKSEPNVGDNGVHGSASPLEALAEKVNWLGINIGHDEFA